MIEQIHEQLVQAKERLLARRKLDAMLAETLRLLQEEGRKCFALKQQIKSEKADVERLEGNSLAALFYAILGTKEKRLDKERQEYLAARLKHDESVEAMREIQKEVERLEQELAAFRDADKTYERLVDYKRRLLVEARDDRAQAILDFAEQLAEFASAKKALEETIQAGMAAKGALEQVRDELRSAQQWGNLDLIAGGIVVTAVKHARIDVAKHRAQAAQRLLRRFQEELADVGQNLQVTLDIGGLSAFADYFFDGLIADFVVQSRIQKATSVCAAAISTVTGAIDACRTRLAEVEKSIVAVTEQRRQLVEQA